MPARKGEKNHRAKKVIWNGRVYKTLNDAARATGRHKSSMSVLVRKGYTRDADVQKDTRPRPITWDDKQYPSINAAAEATDRDSSGMTVLIQKGYRGEDDLKKKRKRWRQEY
jgi:hypothetical protein